MGFFRIGIFFVLLVASAPWFSTAEAKVKIFVDDTRTEYVKVDELDCRIYEKKSGMTIGFKAQIALFALGPELSLGKEEGIQWDRSVHGLIARYKELCNRFNSGAITLKEFSERVEKLDSLTQEMQEFQQKMVQNVKSESKDAFRELDRETTGSSPSMSPGEVSSSISRFDIRLQSLP